MSEIQGMDTIPKEIAAGPWGDEIKRWLPGWDRTGEHNYRPGAATDAVAAQLDLPKHYGNYGDSLLVSE